MIYRPEANGVSLVVIAHKLLSLLGSLGKVKMIDPNSSVSALPTDMLITVCVYPDQLALNEAN